MATYSLGPRMRFDVCWHAPFGLLFGFIGPAGDGYYSTHWFSLHLGPFFVSLWREALPLPYPHPTFSDETQASR